MGVSTRPATLQYFTCTIPSGLTFPFTMAGFVRPFSTTGNIATILSVENAASAGEAHVLQMHGSADAAGTGFSARSVSGGVDKQAHSAVVGLSTADYYGVVGVWTANNLRDVYWNGVNTATQTSTIAPTIDQLTWGALRAGGTPSNYSGFSSGNFFTIWNIALTATEISDWFSDPSGVGNGPYPYIWDLHRESIVWGWRASNNHSGVTVYEEFGGTALVPVNSPGATDDIPWIRPMAA